jgi:hypothetical protein
MFPTDQRKLARRLTAIFERVYDGTLERSHRRFRRQD